MDPIFNIIVILRLHERATMVIKHVFLWRWTGLYQGWIDGPASGAQLLDLCRRTNTNLNDDQIEYCRDGVAANFDISLLCVLLSALSAADPLIEQRMCVL